MTHNVSYEATRIGKPGIHIWNYFVELYMLNYTCIVYIINMHMVVLCFILLLLCSHFSLDSRDIFIHVFQGFFTYTRATKRLFRCQKVIVTVTAKTLQWRHNESDGVSNHQPHDCLFKAQIKENTKAPRHWPLWGEFAGHRWIPRTKGQ